MSNQVKKVFEYSWLPVDDIFTIAHFNQLVRYNEQRGNKYFSVGYQKIYFKNYVGVIQVGNLTLEILPKADRNEDGDTQKWQAALLNMLRTCKYLKLSSLTDANLQLRSASLIDLFFDSFLKEVETLLHRGLNNRYRFHGANLPALKGKIEFNRQIADNLTHRERFFTTHQVYDQDNVHNQILKKALILLQHITTNHHLKVRAARHFLSFESVSNIRPNAATFKKLTFDRKTKDYQYAIKLAELIILQYSPDLKGGSNNILAILFDMNQLFERYIFLNLRKAVSTFEEAQLNVYGQEVSTFWQGRTIRPDIVLTYQSEGREKKLIIDTKWKVLPSADPSIHDLRQMYAYNLHLGATRSILLYPNTDQESTEHLPFEKSVYATVDHSCRIYFLDLFDKTGKINRDIGRQIIREMEIVEEPK